VKCQKAGGFACVKTRFISRQCNWRLNFVTQNPSPSAELWWLVPSKARECRILQNKMEGAKILQVPVFRWYWWRRVSSIV
jgi:hypothetical protein